ncbi:glycosyl hydrolase family 18 protein [Rufibacter latericius]|uniref:chitinase n=1 Tax=Rufibacter latericius TaxID=2487040 RepID=A0A3M9MT55_9BACT|nr:glycosyl hydrolase family 18 protein [Rufibacter latericius]RNI28669.1 T9SS C-terminal target domain-containing protein [Rufibacter latericius]
MDKLLRAVKLFFFFFFLAWQAQAQNKVVAYLPNWLDYNSIARNIDYDKLTHINIAFENTDAAGNLSFTASNNTLIQLAHAKKVKVLVSIGGGMISSNPSMYAVYFDLISDAKRADFVRKIAAYLTSHNLDGIDVDLEGSSINSDYGKFIADLSAVLKPQGKLVTAALAHTNGGDSVTSDTFQYFDFINIMAYDETGPWAPNRPGQHSSFEFAKACLDNWIGRGLPKEKAVLGVPFYGYGFGADFNQGMGFGEIIKRYPGSENQDQVGNTIYYNGIPTIKAKTEYVVEQQYGGIMIWQLAQDATGNYSLLNTIHQVLRKVTGSGPQDAEAIKVHIYPNPTKLPAIGYLAFPAATNKIKVEIRDMKGAKVFDKTFKNKQRQDRIELPGLSQGMYLIRVKADDQVFSNKYLIE